MMGPTSSLIENFSHSLIQDRQTEKISSIDPISSYSSLLSTRNVFHAKWIRQYEKIERLKTSAKYGKFKFSNSKNFQINWREISNEIQKNWQRFWGLDLKMRILANTARLTC
jgi:hypothetical protein